jgi:hypothetical protein
MRHKWEPFALRGKIKKCKICGCIKKTTNLTPEYTLPDGRYQLGKSPECVANIKNIHT